MARIFYGVMGDSRGHMSRSLAVAQHMPEHEYLFAGGGAVPELRDLGYQVLDLPMVHTVLKAGKVDLLATLANSAGVFLRRRAIVSDLAQRIEQFKPDLILTDYEFFTPRAAKLLGVPCVSLDHQHVLTHSRYDRPPGERMNRMTTCFMIRNLFSRADRFLVSSFFRPPPVSDKVEILPPALRQVVKEHEPGPGDHVLVYVRGGSLEWVRDLCLGLGRPCLIYGFGEGLGEGRLTFRANSQHGFLDDLSSAAFVISNGGHSLLSESLYYGKPVFCFPTRMFYEQYLNAWFVGALGYGDFALRREGAFSRLKAFEVRIEEFRTAIAAADFWGNDAIAARVNELLRSNRA